MKHLHHQHTCEAYKSAKQNLTEQHRTDFPPSSLTRDDIDHEASGYVRDGMSTCTCSGQLIDCDLCGRQHVAEYSHEGKYGEGAIYAVICTDDTKNPEHLVGYYTDELVRRDYLVAGHDGREVWQRDVMWVVCVRCDWTQRTSVGNQTHLALRQLNEHECPTDAAAFPDYTGWTVTSSVEAYGEPGNVRGDESSTGSTVSIPVRRATRGEADRETCQGDLSGSVNHRVVYVIDGVEVLGEDAGDNAYLCPGCAHQAATVWDPESWKAPKSIDELRELLTGNPWDSTADAETMARATGSQGATVRHERRELDGSLTVLGEGSYGDTSEAPEGPSAPELDMARAALRELREYVTTIGATLATPAEGWDRDKLAEDLNVIDGLNAKLRELLLGRDA